MCVIQSSTIRTFLCAVAVRTHSNDGLSLISRPITNTIDKNRPSKKRAKITNVCSYVCICACKCICIRQCYWFFWLQIPMKVRISVVFLAAIQRLSWEARFRWSKWRSICVLIDVERWILDLPVWRWGNTIAVCFADLSQSLFAGDTTKSRHETLRTGVILLRMIVGVFEYLFFSNIICWTWQFSMCRDA